MLRPVATPLPLGFLALFVATLSFSALQLEWIGKAQGQTVALAAAAPSRTSLASAAGSDQPLHRPGRC